MIGVAILLGTVALVWALILLPVRQALAVYLIATVLVPETLQMTRGFGMEVTVARVALIAFAFGLLRHRHNGTVGRDPITTPVTWLLALYLAASLVVGVVLAQNDAGIGTAFSRWLLLAEQPGRFVVVVAALRAIDDVDWAVRWLIAAFAVAALAALYERETGTRLLAYIFRTPGLAGATGVPVRGGQRRPTGPFLYPQELGLALAMVTPLTLAGGRFVRRWWSAAVLGLLLGGMAILTISRSALGALAFGVAVTALLARRRQVLGPVLAAGAVIVAVGVLTPSIHAGFVDKVAENTAKGRAEARPEFAQLVANRPWTGAGLGAAPKQADDMYVLQYAEQGVVGLVTGGVLWLGLLVTIGWGALGRAAPGRERDRLIAVACLAGLAAALIWAYVIDLFYTLGTANAFWLLAAIGVVAAERARPPLPRPRPSMVPAVCAATGGLAAGLVLLAVTPRLEVQNAVVEAWPVAAIAASPSSGYNVGKVYAHTVCGLVNNRQAQLRDVAATCRWSTGTPGAVNLRVTVPAGRDAARAVRALTRDLPFLSGLKVAPAGRPARAIPAALRTCPLWLAAAMGLAYGAPLLRPRVRAP
jgi:hypothetical protein